MGFGKHFLNGVVSLVISVVATVVTVDLEEGPWTLWDLVLAVGVSAFLSGFFTSYFAEG